MSSETSHIVQLMEMLSDFDDQWPKPRGTTKSQACYREATRRLIVKLGHLLFVTKAGENARIPRRRPKTGQIWHTKNLILHKLVKTIRKIKLDDEALQTSEYNNNGWVREIFDDEVGLTGQNGPWLENVSSEWIPWLENVPSEWIH